MTVLTLSHSNASPQWLVSQGHCFRCWYTRPPSSPESPPSCGPSRAQTNSSPTVVPINTCPAHKSRNIDPDHWVPLALDQIRRAAFESHIHGSAVTVDDRSWIQRMRNQRQHSNVACNHHGDLNSISNALSAYGIRLSR
jgi:hypothetical protein